MSSSRPALAVAESSRIQFFDLQRQRARLEGDIRRRMDAVLAHGQFILGPEVTQLEQKLAAFAGVGHVIGVSSGRDALMIAMMAMGVKPGDAVFVPAFTFAATAGSVVSVGATPVFVDVDAATFNMDPADLERAIDETVKAGKLRPSVVMPVDLYGLPADYAAISAVAARHGMRVLADAAQSFGGACGNKRVGALAPISATSFYPTKPLGCYGDGGAILAEDAESCREGAHDPLARPRRRRRRGPCSRSHRPARFAAGGDPARQARGLRRGADAPPRHRRALYGGACRRGFRAAHSGGL